MEGGESENDSVKIIIIIIIALSLIKNKRLSKHLYFFIRG
jgi:hypothetical protein